MSAKLVIDFWDATPHLETSLEIALNLSHSCQTYYCFFPYSTLYPNISRKDCRPNERYLRIKELLSSVSSVVCIDPSSVSRSSAKPLFQLPSELTTPNLLTLFYQGLSVGSSLVASLDQQDNLSINPNLNVEGIAKSLNTMICSYSQVYRCVVDLLRELEITDLYVCNGIHLHSHASAGAGLHSSINVHYHERGQTLDRYLITHNNPPHSIHNFKKEYISWLWSYSCSKYDAKGKSSELFRRYVDSCPYFDDTPASPKAKLTNKSINLSDKRRIVLFTSSDAENISAGHSNCPPGGWWTQTEFILDFLLCFQSYSQFFDLTVRIHPNMVNYHYRDSNRIISLLNLFPCTVIHPHDKTNSYEIIHDVDAVFSYGSTIGLEASFMGCPSFCAAPSPFRQLGLVHTISHPADIDKVFSGLKDPQNPYLRPPTLLFDLYALFLDTREIKHQLYRPQTFSTGLFMDQVI